MRILTSHDPRPQASIVAIGYTFMAAPTIVYRIQLDITRRRNPLWAPQAVTSGPYDEQVIDGDLRPGQEDFHESALLPSDDVVSRLGDLARG